MNANLVFFSLTSFLPSKSSGNTEDKLGINDARFSSGNNKINASNQVINAGDGWRRGWGVCGGGLMWSCVRCQILMTQQSLSLILSHAAVIYIDITSRKSNRNVLTLKSETMMRRGGGDMTTYVLFAFFQFPCLLYERTAVDWLISLIHFNTLPKERWIEGGDFGGRWRTLMSLMVGGYIYSQNTLMCEPNAVKAFGEERERKKKSVWPALTPLTSSSYRFVPLIYETHSFNDLKPAPLWIFPLQAVNGQETIRRKSFDTSLQSSKSFIKWIMRGM